MIIMWKFWIAPDWSLIEQFIVHISEYNLEYTFECLKDYVEMSLFA